MIREDQVNLSFWKNLVFAIFFFTVTPLTIGASLYSLIGFSTNKTVSKIGIANPVDANTSLYGARMYASLPNTFPSVSGEAITSDARSEIIRQYLTRHASPLTPYADLIVQEADKYNLDYRLTTAIAQQESNLCKVIPFGTFNCWGWGIHSEGTLGFTSYAEGVKEVTKGLWKYYISSGLDTPEKIMAKYTPLSNGSWAKGVGEFLSQME
jgi:hypothetical protein